METFIECYKTWMKNGELPSDGLCHSLPATLRTSKEFAMVSPSNEEEIVLYHQGKPWVYWGRENYADNSYSLTSLRQTVLLLCACMRNEY